MSHNWACRALVKRPTASAAVAAAPARTMPAVVVADMAQAVDRALMEAAVRVVRPVRFPAAKAVVWAAII